MEFLDSEPCLPDQTPKKPRPELAMQRHGQHDRNLCFDQAYVAAPLAIPDPASSLKRPDRRLPGAKQRASSRGRPLDLKGQLMGLAGLQAEEDRFPDVRQSLLPRPPLRDTAREGWTFDHVVAGLVLFEGHQEPQKTPS